MDKLPQELSYFISERGPFLVVSLRGPLSKGTTEIIDRLRQELEGRKADRVIVSLHDVKEVHVIAIPQFVRFLAAVRQKPAKLGVCFMAPQVFEVLDSRGALRRDELFPTLEVALAALK